jgi:hypothetical protein
LRDELKAQIDEHDLEKDDEVAEEDGARARTSSTSSLPAAAAIAVATPSQHPC